MVRVLTFQQYGLGSNPGADAICGLSKVWVVVGSCPCSKGFLPGSQVFLRSQKPTFLYFNLTWTECMKSHSMDMPLQIPIYLLFIYLFIYLFKLSITASFRSFNAQSAASVSRLSYSTMCTCTQPHFFLSYQTKRRVSSTLQ